MKQADLLLEEYKCHRNEVAAAQQISDLQTRYFQIYGAFISSVAIYILNDTNSWAKSLGITQKTIAALIAAALAFYLVSDAMSTSYKFIVLRGRMAQLERRINRLLRRNNSEDLMTFESQTTPVLFGAFFSGMGFPTPVAWSGIWRFVLFALILIVLVVLSDYSGMARIGFDYSVSILAIGATLAIQTVGMYRRTASTLDPKPIDNLVGSAKFLSWLIALFVFVCVLDAAKYGTPSVPWFLNGGYIFTIFKTFVYSMFCAMFLPTPSEAPLALMPDFIWGNWFMIGSILGFSAIGKGLGAALLAFSTPSIVRFFPGIDKLANASWIKSILNHWQSNQLLFNWKAAVIYFLFQAIPFAPMRTSTIALAFFCKSSKLFVFSIFWLSALGTIFRMLLMLWLIKVGLAILPSFAS